MAGGVVALADSIAHGRCWTTSRRHSQNEETYRRRMSQLRSPLRQTAGSLLLVASIAGCTSEPPDTAAVATTASAAPSAASSDTSPNPAPATSRPATPSVVETAESEPSLASTTVEPPPGTNAGNVNVGCIGSGGSYGGDASDWYRTDVEGIVLFDVGDLHPGAPGAVSLAELLVTVNGGAGRTNTWEFTASGDPSCLIARGAAVINADGSQLRLSIWRLIDAARLESVPQHAPFVRVEPDILVSDASADGDITVLKVLEDGTTIKLAALGADALGYGGWPTTTAPRPGSPPPQPPTQTVDSLIKLAGQAAETLAR